MGILGFLGLGVSRGLRFLLLECFRVIGFEVFTVKAFWCLKVRGFQWLLGLEAFRDFKICGFYGLGFLGFRVISVFRVVVFRDSRVQWF